MHSVTSNTTREPLTAEDKKSAIIRVVTVYLRRTSAADEKNEVGV